MLQTALNAETMMSIKDFCAVAAVIMAVVAGVLYVLTMRALHRNKPFLSPDTPRVIERQE